MKVVVPTTQEFQFDSACSTPYASAPASPKRFGEASERYYYYTSAPSSPSRMSAIYSQLDSLAISGGGKILAKSASVIPFDWEEQATPPDLAFGSAGDVSDPFDFAFDFSVLSEADGSAPALADANDLFEAGKIRPLKPPSRLYHSTNNDTGSFVSSPRSPLATSPRRPVEVANGGGRGREGRIPFASSVVSASRSRKGSRSLSPLRREVGGFQKQKSPNSSSSASAAVKNSGSKRWRLKDLFLFRSASEGRATGNKSKDPLLKYTVLSSSSSSMIKAARVEDSKSSSFRSVRPGGEDSRSSSFRSTTDNHGSMRRAAAAGAVAAAHEMHFAAKKAAAEEMKRKTALPYREGVFNFLRFNLGTPGRSSTTSGRHSFIHWRS